MTKAQFGQRLRIARTDVRYYSKHRRWMAMARSVALVLFCGWISETCQECGRRHHLLWHSPQPLWDELIGRPGGILCPRCFDAKARATGWRHVAEMFKGMSLDPRHHLCFFPGD